jgi:uncharacterized repeat protein (TIGR03803 family)
MLHRTLLAAFLLTTTVSYAQTYTPFYSWNSTDYDWNPNPDLLPVGAALFGTVKFNAAGFENPRDTGCGGYGCGSIYRTDGASLTTLHLFTGADGGMPIAGVIQSGGLLYGTTSYGGPKCAASPEHCGTIFALNPATRTLTTLHAFTGFSDGGGSYAKPVLFEGLLYGTTAIGGDTSQCGGQGCGTIFKLNPSTGQFTTLHKFTSTDGTAYPETSLTLLGTTLYGTTVGNIDAGAVFKINPATGKFTIVHRFGQGTDGLIPSTNLVSCGGALYGTTLGGGTATFGTLFKLIPQTGAESIVHSFAGDADGYNPAGPLAVHAGTLYGAVAYSYQPGPPMFHYPVLAGNIYQNDCATGAEQIIFGFSFNSGVNGATPLGVAYGNGALYGIMQNSGGLFQFSPNQYVSLGLAFKLVPK